MKKGNLSVENYLQAVEKFVGLGGSKKFWAFAPGQVDSYFIHIFSINLFEKFINDRALFKKALSTLDTNVLRWFALPSVVLGLKLANKYEDYHASSKDMSDYVMAVEEVLKEKVSSDPFCRDGQSRVMSGQEIEDKIAKIHFFGPENRRVINILSTTLQSYIWSINFDAFAYGAQWHGPYLIDSQTLVCKTYRDLNSPVWGISELPDKVEIFYLFEEDIDWKVDLMEIAVFQPDIWDKLVSVGILVNNQAIDSLEEVQNLSEEFSKIRDQQVTSIDNLPPQEIIKKGIEVYYFMFRSFFETYQESFQPPRAVYREIENNGLKYWNRFKQRTDKKLMPGKSFFRKLYDPRNDFTG